MVKIALYFIKSEILFQLLSLVLPEGQFLCMPVSKYTTFFFSSCPLQRCFLSNLSIFPVSRKGSSAFETLLVLHQPGLTKELSVMTRLET